MDSATLQTPLQRYYTAFCDKWIQNWFSVISSGGHIRFMQITKISQRVHKGNHPEIVLGPLRDTNQQKSQKKEHFLVNFKSTIRSLLVQSTWGQNGPNPPQIATKFKLALCCREFCEDFRKQKFTKINWVEHFQIAQFLCEPWGKILKRNRIRCFLSI